MNNRMVLEFVFDGKGGIKGIKGLDGAVHELDKGVKNTDRSVKDMFKAFVGADLVSSAIKKVTAAISSLPGRMINIAASFEKYKTVLENTLGSQEAANKLFDYLVDLSAKTPFTIDQLTESAVKLETYGLKTKDVLVTLGDTAASMSKPLMMAVEAIADASMGEFERLKEFGVKAITEGSKSYLMYIDKHGQTVKKAIDRNNPQIVQATLLGIWNEKYKGGMDKLSSTWAGMISTLKDKFTLIMAKIADSGFFDNIKAKLEGILDAIDGWIEDGTIDRVAEKISKALTKIIQTGQDILNFFIDWGAVIVTVGKAWLLYFAASKFSGWASAALGSLKIVSGGFGLLSTSISRAIKGFQLARTFGVGAFGSIRSGVVNAAAPFPALSANISGVRGVLGKLGPIAMAAFAGWEVGKIIGEVTGLNTAIQWVVDKLSMVQEDIDFLSEMKAWNIDLFKYNDSVDDIRDMGKELGVTSGRMLDYANAIWQNEKAFESMNPQVKTLINLLRHKRKVELAGEIRDLGNTLGPPTKKLFALTKRISQNEEAMGKLSKEGKELVMRFVEAGTKIDPLSPKVRELTNKYEEQKSSILKNKMEITRWISKIKELSKDALPAGKKALEDMRVELEKRLKILENEIRLNKEQKKAYEELSKEIGVLSSNGLEGLNNKQIAAIKLWGEKKSVILGNQQSIITFRGVLEGLEKQMGEKVNPRIKEMVEILRENEIEVPKVRMEWENFLPSMADLNSAFDTDIQNQYKKAVDESTQSMGFLTGGVDSLNKELRIINLVYDKNKAQIGKNKEATRALNEYIKGLIEKYKILGKDVPPGLNELFKKTKILKDETGDLVKVFASLSQIGGQVIDALKEMNLVSDKTAGALRGINSGISGIGAGLDAWKKAGEAGKGFNAILGKISAGFSIFTSAVSIIGSLVTVVGELFGHDWDKWSRKVNHAGINVGEFSGKIAELAEELRGDSMSTYDASFRALNRTLPEVIANMDITVDTFESYASSVHHILSQLDDVLSGKSSATIQETLGAFDDAFQALVDKQKELGGVYSAEMARMIGDVRNRGLEVASINEYIAEQMKTGFEAYKQLKESLDSSGIEGEILEITESMKGMKAGSDEFIKASEKLGGLQSKLEDVERAQRIFGDLAIEKFQDMWEYENKVAENPALMNAIQKWETTLKAYTNTWDVNKENFEEFQGKFKEYSKLVVGEYEELTAAGFSSNDALRAMAPTLSRLIELSEAHGFTIDETTQGYIDQAREGGISLAKQQTPTERLAEVMEKIYDLMAGKIPGAMGQMARDGENAFGSMKYQSTLVVGSLDDIEKGVGNVGKAMGGLDEDWKSAVSGNTITAENEKWKNSLLDIQDEMSSIGKWIRKIDRADSWDSQTEQISDYTARLEDIATLLGVTIPDEYNTLEKKHEYIFGILKGDIEELTTLWNHFDPADFGIVTPEMQKADKGKFVDLLSIWTQYSDVILQSDEALKIFYDKLSALNVPDDMKASWQEFFDMIAGEVGEIETLFDHFNPGDFGIVTPKMLETGGVKFEELQGIWETYSASIMSSTENLQVFYDKLSVLNVPDDMKESWNLWLTDIGGLLDEANQKTSTWNGITFDLNDTFQSAGHTFTSVTASMISDEEAFQTYLNCLKNEFGVEIPSEMTTLQKQWGFIMSTMGSETEQFVLTADGQLKTLSSALMGVGRAMTNQEGFGGKYGLFNDIDKEEGTKEFGWFAEVWKQNSQDLMTRPEDLRDFVEDLKKFAVTDNRQGQYTSFIDSLENTYLARAEAGYERIENAWVKTREVEKEEEPPKTSWTPRPSRPASPATTSSTNFTSTSSTTPGVSGQVPGGGDTWIMENHFSEVWNEREMILMMKQAIKGNKYGLRNTVKVAALEGRSG